MRKPKSSNVLPQRKNFVKSSWKQYWNPDSHAFAIYIHDTELVMSTVDHVLDISSTFTAVQPLPVQFDEPDYTSVKSIKLEINNDPPQLDSTQIDSTGTQLSANIYNISSDFFTFLSIINH